MVINVTDGISFLGNWVWKCKIIFIIIINFLHLYMSIVCKLLLMAYCFSGFVQNKVKYSPVTMCVPLACVHACVCVCVCVCVYVPHTKFTYIKQHPPTQVTNTSSQTSPLSNSEYDFPLRLKSFSKRQPVDISCNDKKWPGLEIKVYKTEWSDTRF